MLLRKSMSMPQKILGINIDKTCKEKTAQYSGSILVSTPNCYLLILKIAVKGAQTIWTETL